MHHDAVTYSKVLGHKFSSEVTAYKTAYSQCFIV